MITRAALILAPAVLALGTVTAGAAAATPQDSETGWYQRDLTLDFAAGEACSKQVVIEYTSRQRISVKGPDGLEVLPPAEAQEYFPDEDDVFLIEAEGQFTLRAVDSGRSLWRDSTGSQFYRVVDDGEDLAVFGRGNNFTYGAGVKGIINMSGRQFTYYDDFRDPETGGTLTRLKVKGKLEELCRKVGLRPIDNRVSTR